MRALIRTVNRTERNNKEENRRTNLEYIYAVGRVEEREKERRLSDMRNNANSLSRESSGV